MIVALIVIVVLIVGFAIYMMLANSGIHTPPLLSEADYRAKFPSTDTVAHPA